MAFVKEKFGPDNQWEIERWVEDGGESLGHVSPEELAKIKEQLHNVEQEIDKAVKD